MLSTSLPSAVFVVDGVAADLVRPRDRRAEQVVASSAAATQRSQLLAETPKWLTLLRQSRVRTS
jgi:hypothetical protein